MDSQNAPVSPVVDVEGVSITLREMAARAEFDSCWRGKTDVERGRERLWEIIRPLGSTATPAEISAGDNMVYTIGAVPRRADVPFHIRIESEHFAIAIESDIERVAKSSRNQLKGFALGVGAQNVAGG